MAELPTDLEVDAPCEGLDAESWARRVEAATAEAEKLKAVLARVRTGESRKAALTAVMPERPHRTMLTRLRRYEAGGRDALIDRRVPKSRRKVTAEVKAAVRALAHAMPGTRSAALAGELDNAIGVRLGASTMREVLGELGLSQPRGRPREASSRGAAVEPWEREALPLAGAELLKAAEDELGAVRYLTLAMGAHLEQLPEPTGEVVDDTGRRDERGRFLPSYNAARSRTEPELGGKFDSVERRRDEKDLREMRVANSSFLARYRKDLALTLLPIVVGTPRWSVLRHWQGDHLGTLVGFPYKPATLDKHVRELKLASAADAAREATADFWMRLDHDARRVDAGLVAYIDAATKPVWTHHFTRCAKVSGNGRVMPAMSTVWLNSGSGTPLVYRTFSGHVSVPREVLGLLTQLESAVGSGMTSRVVVLDRESHAVWLFKELDGASWQFVVPLRKSVTGPSARFEELSDWTAYGKEGDEAREGYLWLNDSRPGEPPLRQRVVARKRHRTGKVAWYATNTGREEFDAAAVLDVYFARWPLQEHVFRAGNGRVGLDVHHGYGKKKVTNVGVVTKVDRLEGRLRCLCDEHELVSARAADVADNRRVQHEAVERVEAHVDTLVTKLDSLVEAGATGSGTFLATYDRLAQWQKWLPAARATAKEFDVECRALEQRLAELDKARARVEAERAKLAAQTTIFTVDTELDEIMTAYKLTFMNLARHLMAEHLDVRMELDTLIGSILTLPGERVRTKTTETIRIYRQERDARAMEAVERACESLTALALTRRDGKERRTLRFELVDRPTRHDHGGSN